MRSIIPDMTRRFTANDFYNRPIFETPNFKVIPSLGALIEGWLLIVPKKYYISIGEITDALLVEELSLLINNLSDLFIAEFGKYVIFEHGPVEAKSLVGCGVDYAHVHIVPVDINLIEASKKFSQIDFAWKEIPGIEFTQYYHKANLPYLFVQASKYKSYIGSSEAIPSQFFRQVIANHLGIEEKYNWKEYYWLDNIHKTIRQFSKYPIEILKNQTRKYE